MCNWIQASIFNYLILSIVANCLLWNTEVFSIWWHILKSTEVCCFIISVEINYWYCQYKYKLVQLFGKIIIPNLMCIDKNHRNIVRCNIFVSSYFLSQILVVFQNLAECTCSELTVEVKICISVWKVSWQFYPYMCLYTVLVNACHQSHEVV